MTLGGSQLRDAHAICPLLPNPTKKSISGRLRSASDLEDTGVISREQKAILKDLIIAGDSSVQGAIDRYEAGDPTALEEMIKSGALLARSSDVDLLGDLDLDFLNVHEGDDMMFGNMDDIGGHSSESGRQSGGQQAGMADGIGDLEFNGDFSNTSAHLKQSSGNAYRQSKARGNSVDDIEVHRMRANSLALPGLLLDGANPEDVGQISFGRWMDKAIAGPPNSSATLMQGVTSMRQSAPNIVDANGSRYILNQSSQFASECDDLMASKFSGQSKNTPAPQSQDKQPKPKKEKPKKTSPIKKEKKEQRERKSQSKMKDMMEGITSKKDSTSKKETSKKDSTRKDSTKKDTNKKDSAKKDSTKKDGAKKDPAPTSEEDEDNKEVQSGLGRPRSMSDPNLTVRLDDHGLLCVNGPEGWVGAYSPDSRQLRVNRFLEKRNHRVWVKKVKYDVRKNFADSRLRVKGRFVKKEDEMLMRELMSLT